MALKSTIFKADLALADIDHACYTDLQLTLARHPSETDERMMVRLAALALQAHDVPGFALRLLEERANAGYPPAVFQALLRADAPQLDTAMAFLQQVQQHASQSAGLVLCLGPAPASMARLAGR